METIIDLLERSFSLHKARVGIRIYDDMWTYDDLQNLSSKVSGFLLKAGIEKGEELLS